MEPQTQRKEVTYKDLRHTPNPFGKTPVESTILITVWGQTKLTLTQLSYYLLLYIREFLNLLIYAPYSSLRELSKDIKRILKD